MFSITQDHRHHSFSSQDPVTPRHSYLLLHPLVDLEYLHRQEPAADMYTSVIEYMLYSFSDLLISNIAGSIYGIIQILVLFLALILIISKLLMCLKVLFLFDAFMGHMYTHL